MLTNTNIAGILKIGRTQHVVVMPIMDMESAKSDLNGRKEIVYLLLLVIRK